MSTRRAQKLPRPADGVVSRALGDEYVVLNTRTDEAHALNGTVAEVWRSVCDGSWPDLPDEQVEEIVETLVDLEVLVASGRITRRRMIQGVGTLAAATTIASIVLPTAAYALSSDLVNIASNNLTPTPGATYQVTVSVSGTGAQEPTGNVQVVDQNGNIIAGPAALTQGSGSNPSTHTFSVTAPSAYGSLMLYGSYAGDSRYASGQSASITETVKPSTGQGITLFPAANASTGVPEVLITGSGYAANSPITVKLNGVTASTTGVSTTDANGSIGLISGTASGTPIMSGESTVLTMQLVTGATPTYLTGAQTVLVTDAGSGTANASVTILTNSGLHTTTATAVVPANVTLLGFGLIGAGGDGAGAAGGAGGSVAGTITLASSAGTTLNVDIGAGGSGTTGGSGWATGGAGAVGSTANGGAAGGASAIYFTSTTNIVVVAGGGGGGGAGTGGGAGGAGSGATPGTSGGTAGTDGGGGGTTSGTTGTGGTPGAKNGGSGNAGGTGGKGPGGVGGAGGGSGNEGGGGGGGGVGSGGGGGSGNSAGGTGGGGGGGGGSGYSGGTGSGATAITVSVATTGTGKGIEGTSGISGVGGASGGNAGTDGYALIFYGGSGT